jgi:alkanesulfonate monooxygenase SsuD/methylene tetrahydromethanopterin reductase-like flavin-dependent oxidoreductase (luciferase family)
VSNFQFGLMIRGQYPRGEDLQARFDDLCAFARLADQLGFDCITKGSHYATTSLSDFQQIPFLARIMVEAPNCRLNAGVSLLPLHKPLDIAEQIGTLDVMSKGRMILSVALGYREAEFKAFGTTQSERVQRMEENLIAIRRLWTEDKVTMKGSHFELDDTSLGIYPVQDPHPPIWMGANANPAIRRAARMSDCWYVPPHNKLSIIQQQLDVYKRELDKCNKPFPIEFPARREVFVAKDRAEAMRLCKPALENKYKAYIEWGQNAPMPEGDSLDLAIDELVKDRFIIGSVDEVAEQIISFARGTGINHLIASMHWPGMEAEVAMDAMRMYAEEVMPKVRQAV